MTIFSNIFHLLLILKATYFQGQTVSKPNSLVVDVTSANKPGMVYVMLSRVCSLDQLHIVDKMDPEKITVDEKVRIEAARMDQVSMNKNPVKWMDSTVSGLKVCSFNTSSLRKHIDDVKRDPVLLQSDVLIIQETWLEEGEEKDERYELEGFRGYFTSVGRGKGLAVYVKKELNILSVSKLGEPNIQLTKIEMRKFDIVGLYRSKEETPFSARNILQNFVDTNKDTLVIGDLNFGANEDNDFSRYLEREGFTQLVTLPTHIKGGIES